MPSTGHDWGEILSHLNTSWGVEEVANIMSMINKRTTPVEEDQGLIKHVVYSPLVDLHTNENTSLSVTADFEKTVDVDHYDGLGLTKMIPDEVRTYDLIHDNSNVTATTGATYKNFFQAPGNTQFESSTIGRKNMGGFTTDGSSYMIINDHSWLNVTDEIMINGWFYFKANGGSDEMLVNKGTDQWELKTISGNTLRFRIEIGGVMYDLDYAYTPDAWYKVVAQAKSGTQELWVGDVLRDSDTQTGAIGTNTTNLGIMGTAAGGSLLGSGNAMAWLSIANGFGDAAWLSNYYDNNILDYDTDVAGEPEEITTIPFIGSIQEMPNAYVGMFIV